MAVDKKLSVINIGGGFHHASADRGGGFCVYADISVAIKSLLKERRIKNAMIIDLDAHQVSTGSINRVFKGRVPLVDQKLPKNSQK